MFEPAEAYQARAVDEETLPTIRWLLSICPQGADHHQEYLADLLYEFHTLPYRPLDQDVAVAVEALHVKGEVRG